jgi:hypothetical protein
MTEYGISNIRLVDARWPMADPPSGDVALIAHVGYDIEAIGPFVDAMEAAASRICVAVLMEQPPASVADPFWPLVHGEPRSALPALAEFTELLVARGSEPSVTLVDREPRRFASRDELGRFLRRQLWVADGGEKEKLFNAALEELAVETDGQFGLAVPGAPRIGIVVWEPSKGSER